MDEKQFQGVYATLQINEPQPPSVENEVLAMMPGMGTLCKCNGTAVYPEGVSPAGIGLIRTEPGAQQPSDQEFFDAPARTEPDPQNNDKWEYTGSDLQVRGESPAPATANNTLWAGLCWAEMSGNPTEPPIQHVLVTSVEFIGQQVTRCS